MFPCTEIFCTSKMDKLHEKLCENLQTINKVLNATFPSESK